MTLFVSTSQRLALAFALAALLACTMPSSASDMGVAAGAQITAATYQDVLDNQLYTHDGDDRRYGPEHDLARDNIETLMEGFGLSVVLEPFNYSGDTYYNVVGTKVGTTYPDQEYIVCAHFDSVGNPGADDNGSGTALVLEAARVLSQYDAEYTLRFIAFDREEQGLVGSDAYVGDHSGDDILGVVNVDMVAYASGTGMLNIYGHTASNPIKNAIAAATNTYGDGLWA